MNRDDIERLVDEAVCDPCVHGSSRPHAVDSEVVAKCRPTEFGQRMSEDGVYYEEFVDRFRPPGTSGRRCSLFMVDSPDDLNIAGAAEDYVYRVAPARPVVRADFGWFQKLLGEPYLSNNPKAEEYAKRYWSGDPSDYRGSHVVEYLAPAFTIRRKLEHVPVVLRPRAGKKSKRKP